MANRGELTVFIPLSKVPDPKQRNELETLYKAEEAWDEEYGPAFNEGKLAWLAEEGVKTETDQDGNIRIAIAADFMVRDGEVWVSTESAYNRTMLQVRQSDDIFVKEVPMVRLFKWDIPWWVQLPFAGGEKRCNASTKEEVGHLAWEAPLSLILGNLDYAIEVYSVFPIWGPAFQWSWVFQSVDYFNDLGAWLSEIHHVCPEAIAILDWSEIAWNMMSPSQTIAHDIPNQLMQDARQMEADKERLYDRKITMDEFAEKYAMKTSDDDMNGYIAEGEKFVALVAKELSGHPGLFRETGGER